MNAEKQRQGEYQNHRGEYQNKNANEQMFNNRSTFVEQNKAKRSEENQNNQVDRQIKWAASDTANQQPISNQSATNQKSVSDEELTASSKKLAEMSLRQNTQQNRLPAPKAQSQISRQPEKSPESFTSIADEDAPF